VRPKCQERRGQYPARCAETFGSEWKLQSPSRRLQELEISPLGFDTAEVHPVTGFTRVERCNRQMIRRSG